VNAGDWALPAADASAMVVWGRVSPFEAAAMVVCPACDAPAQSPVGVNWVP